MRDNVTATAADANPDYGVSSFDDQMHASLAILQACGYTCYTTCYTTCDTTCHTTYYASLAILQACGQP